MKKSALAVSTLMLLSLMTHLRAHAASAPPATLDVAIGAAAHSANTPLSGAARARQAAPATADADADAAASVVLDKEHSGTMQSAQAAAVDAPAAPEPGPYAMLAVGLGALCLSAKSRGDNKFAA